MWGGGGCDQGVEEQRGEFWAHAGGVSSRCEFVPQESQGAAEAVFEEIVAPGDGNSDVVGGVVVDVEGLCAVELCQRGSDEVHLHHIGVQR